MSIQGQHIIDKPLHTPRRVGQIDNTNITETRCIKFKAVTTSTSWGEHVRFGCDYGSTGTRTVPGNHLVPGRPDPKGPRGGKGAPSLGQDVYRSARRSSTRFTHTLCSVGRCRSAISPIRAHPHVTESAPGRPGRGPGAFLPASLGMQGRGQHSWSRLSTNCAWTSCLI